MRTLVAITMLAVLLSCTPAQLRIVNDIGAARGVNPLTASEAIDLWCRNTPKARATWLTTGGLEALLELGEPLPDCPTEVAAAVQHPTGWVNSGIGGVWVPSIEAAIRRCESGGNPTAQNPVSTASGLHQFLDSSWHGYGHAHRFGVSKARYATPTQQMEAFVITYLRDGTRPWAASSHCW